MHGKAGVFVSNIVRYNVMFFPAKVDDEMQRYFVEQTAFSDGVVMITGDDAHHLIRVLRAEPGDQCIVSDGQTREALVTVSELLKDRVVGHVEEWLPLEAEPAVEVWVAQGLPKGDKMELVIQKGTEIGAARFIPFVSERTVVQLDAKKEAKRVERWSKIAKEAAEQSHRNRVPSVEAPYTWKQLLALVPEMDAAWICYEKEGKQAFRQVIREALTEAVQHTAERKPRFMLLIGPEGGFTEAEVAAAEAAGCRSVGLGKRILRTETAAMVGLTCILYEAGEMGGETSCRQ